MSSAIGACRQGAVWRMIVRRFSSWPKPLAHRPEQLHRVDRLARIPARLQTARRTSRTPWPGASLAFRPLAPAARRPAGQRHRDDTERAGRLRPARRARAPGWPREHCQTVAIDTRGSEGYTSAGCRGICRRSIVPCHSAKDEPTAHRLAIQSGKSSSRQTFPRSPEIQCAGQEQGGAAEK